MSFVQRKGGSIIILDHPTPRRPRIERIHASKSSAHSNVTARKEISSSMRRAALLSQTARALPTRDSKPAEGDHISFLGAVGRGKHGSPEGEPNLYLLDYR
jgi:hypothetical protein